jgi:hypothetical protein
MHLNRSCCIRCSDVLIKGGGSLGWILLSLVTASGGGAEFSPSLSEGMLVPQAVGPPLVEMVHVPRCCVSFTHREGERALNLNMKGHRVRRSGTFRWEDMRLIVMP